MRVRWKDFELPTRVICDSADSSDTYAKFFAEPFERGYGHTLGNSFRRILLSSIEGAAVTAVKITNVDHEFSTMEGVYEDVTDIILNLKQLLIRYEGDVPRRLKLTAKKAGDVTAKAFEEDAKVEIVNKDLKVVTLTKDVDFEMEVEIQKGRGYVTAEENTREGQEIGLIPIDSIFSPIRRVKYYVEDTRVGKLTNYDRLILEIWTDGTIEPEMALVEASKILRKHLNPFVQYFELGKELQINERKEEEARKKEKYLEDLRQKLAMSISELDLSVRSANCLASEKIETIGELVVRTENELLKVRNFGKTSLKEVRKKLDEMSLELGMDLDEIFGNKGAAYAS